MAETGRGGLSPQDQAAFDRALQGVEQHFGSGGSATAVATPETPAAAGEVVPLAGQPKKPSLLKRILGRGGSPAAANGGTPTVEQQGPDIVEPADSPAPGEETLSPDQVGLSRKIWKGLKTGFKAWVQNLDPRGKDAYWIAGAGVGAVESLLFQTVPLGPANGLIKAGLNFAAAQAVYGAAKGYYAFAEGRTRSRYTDEAERQAAVERLRDSKKSVEAKIRNGFLGMSAAATYVSFGGIAAHLAPEVLKAVGVEIVMPTLGEAPPPGSISAIESAGTTIPGSEMAPAAPVLAPTADLSGVHAAVPAVHLPEAPTGGAISSTELQTLGMSGESTAAQPLNVTGPIPAGPVSASAPASSGGIFGVQMPSVEAPAAGSVTATEAQVLGGNVPGEGLPTAQTAASTAVPTVPSADSASIFGVQAPNLETPPAGSITDTELKTVGANVEGLSQPTATVSTPTSAGESGDFLGVKWPSLGEAPAGGSITDTEARALGLNIDGGTQPAEITSAAASAVDSSAPAAGSITDTEFRTMGGSGESITPATNAAPAPVTEASVAERATRIAEPQAPLDASPQPAAVSAATVDTSAVNAPATPNIGLGVNASAGTVSAPSADVTSTALSESQTKAVKAMETLFASADNPAAQAVGAHFDQTNEIADAAIAKAGINPATLSASQYEAVRSAVQDQFELTANEAFTKAAAKVADPDKIQEAVKEGKEVFGAYLQNDSGQERLTGLARKVLDAQLGVNNQIAENINQVLTPDIVSSADVQSSVGQTLVDHGYDLTSWGADKAQLFGAEIAVNYDALSNYWGEVAKAGNLPDGLHFPMSPGEINSLVEAAQNGDAEALQKLKDALHWFPADKKFKILNKAGIAAVLKAIK